MKQVAERTTLIDVEYLGHRGVIASCLLEGDGELALVDPGPTSSLANLRRKLNGRGIRVADLTALLLTHIHLDHAGASGTLVRENPRLRVYVHERGARHLVNPARLLESARRLYRDAMDQLWGEFLAVPEENVVALAGGEELRLAGRAIEVQYTPGHATHHVTYFDSSTAVAFTGDTAGMCYPGSRCVAPLTPPPDIDVEEWEQSIERILAWRPAKVLLSHFGPFEPAEEHLASLRERLRRWAQWALETLQSGASDAECAAQFTRQVIAEMRHHVPADDAVRYERGGDLEQCWYGLARYWRKRAEKAAQR